MRLNLRGVRARAVTGSVLAILVFGVFLGAATYAVVSRLAYASLEEIVTTRVDEVASQLQASEDSPPDLEGMEVASPVGVQVVAADGTIIAATPGLRSDLRLCAAPPGYLVQTRQVATPSGDVTVCSGASTASVERVEQGILLVLVIVLPLVILAVAVVVWRAVGRALGSVEHLREQAEAISEVETASLEVQPTGDEVERLGHTLNELLDRLHAQSRTTRQFIADAGHELRNPLATLRVAMEFEESPSESQHVALEELGRLEELVRDLLVLARTDARDSHVREPVDLADIVQASVRAHTGLREEVTISSSVHPAPLIGDSKELRQAVDNLVANAVRHAASSVAVGLATADGSYLLRIDDDGDGVAPEDCARIFDRFVRLDDSRHRDEGGSGLGLAIVQSLVQAHGGAVHAEPRPGGHFVVRLPIDG